MNLSAVLLAGGESRRMGRDKATLPWNGAPLWQRQVGLLRTLAPSALFVSGRLPPAWLPTGAQFIADPAPPRGPLGGLAAVLAALRSTHLLALAVDMPAMSSGHLATLWRAASPGCGVLPCLDGRAMPIPAIYPAESAQVAAGLLTGEEVSLMNFTRMLTESGLMKCYAVAASDANLYANCNTPEEWKNLGARRRPGED